MSTLNNDNTKPKASKESKKVFLGFCGSKSSMVAAFLLQQQGYEVIGVFFNFSLPTSSSGFQAWDEKEVKKCASKLNIELKVISAYEQYIESVYEYYCAKIIEKIPCDIRSLETQLILSLLAKEASTQNAFICTGHKARVFSQTKKGNHISSILSAKYSEQDDSHQFALVSPEILNYTLLPIGELSLKQVDRLLSIIGVKPQFRDVNGTGNFPSFAIPTDLSHLFSKTEARRNSSQIIFDILNVSPFLNRQTPIKAMIKFPPAKWLEGELYFKSNDTFIFNLSSDKHKDKDKDKESDLVNPLVYPQALYIKKGTDFLLVSGVSARSF